VGSSLECGRSWVQAQVVMGFVLLNFMYMCIMFCRSLFVLLTIVLSVFLRFTDSDYPFRYLQTLLSTCNHVHKIKQHESHYNLGELGCSGKVSSSCSTSGSRRITLVTNPVIRHE
jgi:hypothetical protein